MPTNNTTEDDVTNRLETLKDKNFISSHNHQLLEDLVEDLQKNDTTGYYRQLWYLSKFTTMLDRHINEEELTTTKMDELTYEDMEIINSNIKKDEKNYADSTINGFRSAWRRFWENQYPFDFERPTRVKKIFQGDVLDNKNDPQRKYETQVLTPQQVEKLSKQAQNPRDALLPYFLMDTGCRALSIEAQSRSSINAEGSPYEITLPPKIPEKSEPRTLPLMFCQEKLKNWLEHHPLKDQDDFPLWVSLDNRGKKNYGEEMTSRGINKILKRLGRRADLDGINPERLSIYTFRHSSVTWRCTEDENGFNLGRLMWWYDWISTKRPKTYLSMDNERMLKAVKKDHGFSVDDDSESSPMTLKKCPRCDHEESISADASYCPNCQMPLDSDTAIRDQALIEAGEKVVEMKLDEKADDQDVRELVAEI